MNYYKRHIGDYMKDASHLSLLEHGVYMRLLDVYYTRECAIPVDQAARLISARTKEEKAALEVVTCEFFTVVDGAYTQTRCDSEIATMQQKTETNREVGRLGGRPKKETQTVSDGNPEITQTVSEKNPNLTLANSHKPITNTPKAPKGADVRFDAFWRAYPNRVGKDAARSAFDKRKVDDDLLALMLSAITAQAKSEKWTKDGGQFIPNPATWLNQGRWMDDTNAEQPQRVRGLVL
jgi:uncharacterized protein YdaU (DUF1376 family)